MGKLRKTLQREVFDALDQSIFSTDDFHIEFTDPDESGVLVRITFIHDEAYCYIVGKPEKNKYSRVSFAVHRSPGDLQEIEEVRFSTFQETVGAIPNWCGEIRNELKAAQPIYREIDNLREIIEEHFSASLKDDDEFGVAEINDLYDKLEELQKRVGSLEKEKIITQKQLHDFI